MSRRRNPLLYMPAFALSGAAHALGLGELRVTSALNEPLSAQIDIVGATNDDLSNLRAAVANREVFVRNGAERPSFLSSATFKVDKDTHGKPILTVRSTEAFTEPLVNFFVDLRWTGGELVREYTLLLDPPTITESYRDAPQADSPAAASASASAPTGDGEPAVPAAAAPPPAPSARATERASLHTPLPKRYTVAPRDTLGAIAHRAGARSDADMMKMIVAIFHANPGAFAGNINRLRVGAVLDIPSVEELSAVSSKEAAREVHAQMLAWHAATGVRLAGAGQPNRRGAAAAEPAPAGERPANSESIADLQSRIQSLAQALDEIKRLNEQAQLQALNQTPAAPVQAGATVQAGPAATVQAGATVPAAVASASAPEAAVAATASAPESAPVATRVLPRTEFKDVVPVPNPAPAAPPAESSSLTWIAGAVGTLALVLAGAFAGLRWYARKVAAQGSGASTSLKRPKNEGADDWMVDETGADPGVDARGSSRTSIEPAVRVESAARSDSGARGESSRGTAGSRQDTHLHLDVQSRIQAESSIEVHEGFDAESTAELQSNIDAMAALVGQSSIDDSTAHMEFTGITRSAHALGGDTTVSQAVGTVPAMEMTVEIPPQETNLDYTLLDLESSETHVNMPSGLHDHVVFTERRTNLVDVLRQAVEREPDRLDLRMKLLEMYHSTASNNRQGFLDAARKFATQPNYATTAEWEKIAAMGRQIAPDDPLFLLDPTVNQKLADCA